MGNSRKQTFGDKPKGHAKPKGGKGQSKDKNRHSKQVKTKSKTVNRSLGKRQQRIAMAKASAPSATNPIDRNRGIDEAAPTSISDVTELPPTQEEMQKS